MDEDDAEEHFGAPWAGKTLTYCEEFLILEGQRGSAVVIEKCELTSMAIWKISNMSIEIPKEATNDSVILQLDCCSLIVTSRRKNTVINSKKTNNIKHRSNFNFL